MKGEFNLEPSAAMVMQWAKGYYCRPPVKIFLDNLDLSAGDELLNNCNEVCDWYREVILNSKHLINYLTINTLFDQPKKSQVVILGAGMSPLALELIYHYPNKVSNVFEIDKHYMNKKKMIYEDLFPEYAQRITCTEMDVSRRDLINKLESSTSFELEKPILVISEGISYYITINDLKKLLIDFSSPQRHNSFLLEYLVPLNQITDQRKDIPEEIFEIIKDSRNIPNIYHYSYNQLESLFKAVWGKIISHYTLKEMENLRTSSNKFFNSTEEGWIECVLGKI
jgi:O-methyltransferase involved in polyketide biosynthesis